MPTQLGLGSGLGSSRMSLECKTERALGLAQAGEPLSSVRVPCWLEARLSSLIDLA